MLYSLSLAELFVATLNPLSRQTFLGSSQLSSIFYHDKKLLCRDRNLLLSNFYCRDIIFLCRDRGSCLKFVILSQHFFVIFSISVMTIFVFVATKFTSASCCVCHNIKLLCHNKVFLSPIPGSECCFTT